MKLKLKIREKIFHWIQKFKSNKKLNEITETKKHSFKKQRKKSKRKRKFVFTLALGIQFWIGSPKVSNAETDNIEIINFSTVVPLEKIISVINLNDFQDSSKSFHNLPGVVDNSFDSKKMEKNEDQKQVKPSSTSIFADAFPISSMQRRSFQQSSRPRNEYFKPSSYLQTEYRWPSPFKPRSFVPPVIFKPGLVPKLHKINNNYDLEEFRETEWALQRNICSNSSVRPTLWIDSILYTIEKTFINIICRKIEKIVSTRAELFFELFVDKVQEIRAKSKVSDNNLNYSDYSNDPYYSEMQLKNLRNSIKKKSNIITPLSKGFDKNNKKHFVIDKEGNYHNITAGREKSCQSTESFESLSTNDLIFFRKDEDIFIRGRIPYEQARDKWKHIIDFDAVRFKEIVSIPKEVKKDVEDLSRNKDIATFNSKYSPNKLKKLGKNLTVEEVNNFRYAIKSFCLDETNQVILDGTFYANLAKKTGDPTIQRNGTYIVKEIHENLTKFVFLEKNNSTYSGNPHSYISGWDIILKEEIEDLKNNHNIK